MGGLSPQEIYDNFHTHATGTDALQAAQQAAYRLAGTYQDRAVAIQKLIDGIKSGWTGQASEAASTGLAPLAEDTLQRGDDLNTAQDLVFRQADSWHTAVAKVQPMPPQPQLQNVITVFSNGQLPQPILDQIQHYSGVAQSNVDAYQQYVAASQYNAATLPNSASGATSATVPVTAIAPATTTGERGPTGKAHPVDNVSPRHARPTGGEQHVASVGSSPASDRPVPAGTTAPAATSPITVPTAVASGTVSVTAPANADLTAVVTDRFGNPPESVAPPVDRSVGGVDGVSVPVPGASDGERLPGGRSGGSAGATEEEVPAGEPIAGADGRSGGVTAGPVGGRGARGEQDKEHKRKYEYGDDPEETFGVSDVVAPPVIGETVAERRVREGEASA